jgi:glycosyltransferase involved in cell wall biosynthesis
VRILHISSARSLGGGERHLADLANALTQRGHEVYAALPTHSPLRQELYALPLQNIFTLRLRNALDIRSALELSRLVREHRIEIVHAHVARDYPLAALATRRNRRAKLIITRHVLFPLNKLHSVTLSHVARVICVSHAVKRVLSAQNIFKANRISVIPNGINFRCLDESLENFDREEFRKRMKIPSGSLLIGTVGELKKQKGHEDFLRALEHHSSLKRLIAELDLTNRAHLTGWLDDVGPLLAALDVYVSASHTESFGLAIVEAMALGLPVVATETEGAQEIINRDDIGVLVRVGDSEAMANALLRLLEDAHARKRIGALARATARTRFSLATMVDETEKAYFEAQVSGAKSQEPDEKKN